MAEKEDKSSSPQNLVCPLCLDVFEDATILTCGHTLCRKCLQEYNASHQDLYHMVCPLCRKATKFPENRVKGLPANVDENYCLRGGVNAVLELRPKCTSCKFQGDAVSFCSTCNVYMCDICHMGHQRLTLFFEGHQVTSLMEDVLSGKVSVDQIAEKCVVHRHEIRDLFCEDCKVHICLKCVIVEHRDHKIKNQHDFEKELRKKVAALIQRCKTKKSELEKNIQNTVAQRQEVHIAIQKLEADVRKAYDTKAKQLKDNERLLLQEIQSLQRGFHDDLDALKAQDRQRIKSITSSANLVANDRLGHLETDSLAAHTLLCDELDDLLKEATDNTSAADISETAQDKRFLAADETLLDLGKVYMPSLRVVKEIDFSGEIFGLTKKLEDSVAVAGCGCQHIEVVNCAGNINTLTGLPAQSYYYDIAIQENGTIVVSSTSSAAVINIHAPDGSKKSTINLAVHCCSSVSISHSDEIIAANGKNQIYIFDPSGNALKHIVPTTHRSVQAFAARSGAIVTSSCTYSPSVLTVYDRVGKAGSSLRANQGEYLYAAADDQDRVYVASVNPNSGKVLITLYKLEHLNLTEKYRFEELKCSFTSSYCYLVYLSHNMLALSTGRKLYFMTIYGKA